MAGFSRYLDPGGEKRAARGASEHFDLDEGGVDISVPRLVNERAFAAALPPVDDNLLPTSRRD